MPEFSSTLFADVMENNYKSCHICLKKMRHTVYSLSVQIVTMFTMLNVSMQTEMILYIMLHGTVYIVCRLYCH